MEKQNQEEISRIEEILLKNGSMLRYEDIEEKDLFMPGKDYYYIHHHNGALDHFLDNYGCPKRESYGSKYLGVKKEVVVSLIEETLSTGQSNKTLETKLVLGVADHENELSDDITHSANTYSFDGNTILSLERNNGDQWRFSVRISGYIYTLERINSTLQFERKIMCHV